MTYEHVKLEIDERNVATLTLNREDKHNAMGHGFTSQWSSGGGEMALHQIPNSLCVV